ncbi:kinesin heavy chain [Cystoisospora suis]|uniref:Kinesin-like protein n=1 Tax=Cystoisospora suis TaxID=483139 RepID=A0A2C6JSL8_9APIC|nr:kinesin heavy chain [Cystoisospora suis]
MGRGGRNETLPSGVSNSPSSSPKETVEADNVPDSPPGSSPLKSTEARNVKRKTLSRGEKAKRQSEDLKNEPVSQKSPENTVGSDPIQKNGPESTRNSHTGESETATRPSQADVLLSTHEPEKAEPEKARDAERVAPPAAEDKPQDGRAKAPAGPKRPGVLREPCRAISDQGEQARTGVSPTPEATHKADGQPIGQVFGPSATIDAPARVDATREKFLPSEDVPAARRPHDDESREKPTLLDTAPAPPETWGGATWEASSNAPQVQVPTVAKGCIVCVRIRPESVQEVASGGNICVFTQTEESQSPSLIVTGNRDQRYKFHYDYVFDQDASQEKVYSAACLPLVDKLLSGYSASVIAYGQTGAGKSYTMIGETGADGFQRALTDPTTKGVTPRIIDAIFQRIQALASNDADVVFSLRASLMEIYNETVRDLLTPSRDNLNIRESAHASTIITDATEVPISSMKEALGVVQAGFANRALGTTLSNEKSSRSHAIFQLTVRRDSMRDCTTKMSQLFLVDLAGSERVAKADSSGERLREAQNINRSLLALGNVISAVPSGGGSKKHIPYRESKLTRLLQHSFGGNSFTVVLLCCSPHSFNVRETLSTLRFGDRAAHLRNKPQSVETLSPDLLQKRLIEAQTELRFSQARLRACVTQNARQLEALKMLQKYLPPDARLTQDDAVLLEKALAGYDFLESSSPQPPRAVSPKQGISRPKSKPTMPPAQSWKSQPHNRWPSVSPVTKFDSQSPSLLKDPTRGIRPQSQPRAAAAWPANEPNFRVKACPPTRQHPPSLSLHEGGERHENEATGQENLGSPERELTGVCRPLVPRAGVVPPRTGLRGQAVAHEPATASTPEAKPQTPPAQQPGPSSQSAPSSPSKNGGTADHTAARTAGADPEPDGAAEKSLRAEAPQHHPSHDNGKFPPPRLLTALHC